MAPDWARLPLVVHRHRGDDHRQPGGDLGRLLGHPSGGSARIPAAPQDRAHQREGCRADLHPGGQLGPAVHGDRAGSRLPRIRQAGVGLWHRRDRNHADHYHDARRARLPGVALEPHPGGRNDRHLPARRRNILRVEHHEDPGRRLVPVARRRDHLHGAHYLGQRAPTDASRGLPSSALPLEVFIKSAAASVHRVRGTSVFLSTSADDGAGRAAPQFEAQPGTAQPRA